MKVSELLEVRRENWKQLEEYCRRMEAPRRSLGPIARTHFATLYRGACADLALADAYQLPPGTVQYLHALVGRAHNQFYRSRSFDFRRWRRILLVEVPQRVFNDRCVQVAFCLFWGVFLLSAYLAWRSELWPAYAEAVLQESGIEQLERSFSQPLGDREPGENARMAGFYIYNNTSIGLQCFASMVLLIPGFLITVFNAAHLGAAFGYMARPDVTGGENFFEFVTAHAPFELTAIVLSAGAGLRLGMGWLRTGGLTRVASLQKTGVEAMPLMGSVMILFFLAALIEGFVSPSSAPIQLKQGVAILTSILLVFYFAVLGFPRGGPSTESESRATG